METAFSFLDLEDCSTEDRTELESLLDLAPPKATPVSAPPTAISTPLLLNGGMLPTSFPPPPLPHLQPHSVYAHNPNQVPFYHQLPRDDLTLQQQQQLNSLGASPYGSVYINNMTANVNLHHGVTNGHRDDPAITSTGPPQSRAHHHPVTQSPMFQGYPHLLHHAPGIPFMPMMPSLPLAPPMMSMPPHTIMQPHPPHPQHSMAQELQQHMQPQSGFPAPPHVSQSGFPAPPQLSQAGFPAPPHISQSGFPAPPQVSQSGFPAPPVVPQPTFPAPPQVSQAGFPAPPPIPPQSRPQTVVVTNEAQPVEKKQESVVAKQQIEEPEKVQEKEEVENDDVKETEKVEEINSEPEQINTDTIEEVENQEEVNQNEEQFLVKNGLEESQAPKSWASLFHKADSIVISANDKPMAKISPYSNAINTDGAKAREAGHGLKEQHGFENGIESDKLITFFAEYSLNHKSPALKPRGLNNRSNWCFVNAILQALVACPPFYNFMKAIPLGDEAVVSAYGSKLSKLKAVYDFVKESELMTKMTKRDKAKKVEDLPLSKTSEATTVFNMLLSLSSDTFQVVEGRQEDAEEFLTFLLNGINDEILALRKTQQQEEKPPSESEFDHGDADEWKEVGPKNKSCITRRQQALCGQETPLSQMFQGMSRSCLQHSSSEPTATLQPFFTLQLDIQSESVRSVGDALINNFTTESINDYVCTTTKKEVEVSRSLSLEHLPPILILHFKRFIYDETSRGCQKVLKEIDFPVDLDIPRDIISPNSRGKYSGKQKQYKLFAVVYHKGSEATKGHYVTDIYHTGLASWLNCDDALVKCVSESTVLAHSTNCVPYILFYRRADTMVGLEKNKNN